ncbi:MAG: alpha-L-fucosidase [Christensenellales bacterium]
MTEIEKRTQRTQWFISARFGMFIHWGLYAIPARGEWVRSVEKISNEDYQPYFNAFNPSDFNPKAWASAAKAAGMQYAVMTAKHHDGFCLFDSKYTDYKSVNTPCGKDLVKEYVEAFREAGLKVGLYYSLLDWHHPDYPHYGDAHHPMRDNPAYSNKDRDFSRYISYFHNQVKELMTGYGKIDIVWFDFSYGDMAGETWQATKLVNMVRELQPGILIDNRLEGSGDGVTKGTLLQAKPSVFAGDFAGPEQILPPKGIYNELGDPVPWEACITMNNNWGYATLDKDFKPAKLLIRKLVECVSKGGNMLLNVGPDANGRIPEESLTILQEIGQWMSRNGESVYGCGPAGLPKPDWGWYTRKGNTLYAHILEPSIGPLALVNLGGRLSSPRLVSDGSELLPANAFNINGIKEHVFINFGPGAGTYPLPDQTDTVVRFRID